MPAGSPGFLAALDSALAAPQGLTPRQPGSQTAVPGQSPAQVCYRSIAPCSLPPPTSLVNLYDLPRTALGELLASWGYSAFHRDALWEALYRKQVESLDALEGLLRPDLVKRLREHALLRRPAVHHETFSSDGYTHKLLLRLHDGQTIETVLMRFKGRATVCISTQAGCAMGCVFCATGQMGLVRHLSPGEIVAPGAPRHRHPAPVAASPCATSSSWAWASPCTTTTATMEAVDILVDRWAWPSARASSP